MFLVDVAKLKSIFFGKVFAGVRGRANALKVHGKKCICVSERGVVLVFCLVPPEPFECKVRRGLVVGCYGLGVWVRRGVGGGECGSQGRVL